MNQLNFTVLGKRGVGKTTLMTSMYRQTSFCLQGTGISLHAHLATSTSMDKELGNLQRIANETKAIVKRDGIKGTGQEKEYQFDLGPDGSRGEIKINFTDFPGDWLQEPDKQGRVVELGSNADVILIPIDSPPLLEKDGRYNDEVNGPSHVSAIIHEIMNRTDDGRRRLVIFAPIRCEKYLSSENKRSGELLSRVHEEYRGTIARLDGGNNAVVITPIQTVGCLKYSHLKEPVNHDDDLLLYFRKTISSDRYAPVDCDQPMRYLLRFLLKRQHEAKAGTIFHWLTRGWFADKRYQNAVNSISEGCKDGVDGFEIVQGRHLL